MKPSTRAGDRFAGLPLGSDLLFGWSLFVLAIAVSWVLPFPLSAISLIAAILILRKRLSAFALHMSYLGLVAGLAYLIMLLILAGRYPNWNQELVEERKHWLVWGSNLGLAEGFARHRFDGTDSYTERYLP